MTRRFYVDDWRAGTEVTGYIRTQEPAGLSLSFLGTAGGGSGITIDDPTNSLNLIGWHPFYATEDAADPIRIYTGMLFSKTITELDGRGGISGRQWDCDLLDINRILGMKIIRGASANRVRESETARLNFILKEAIGGITGLVFDNGGLHPNATRIFDATDLRRKTAEQALSELAGDERVFALYWDNNATTGEEISLWWSSPDAVRGDQAAKLSNAPGDTYRADDPTSLVFAADAIKLSRNPEDVYDGVDLKHINGDIYRTAPATTATFFAAMGPGFGRDLVYDSTLIGAADTAEVFAARFLAKGSVEFDTITCTVRVAAADLQKFREGFRNQVKFTHLPGYTSYTWMTVIERTIKVPDNAALGMYDVDLTLVTQAPVSTGVGAGGGTGDFPHPPATAPSLVQHQMSYTVAATLPATPGVGDLLVLVQSKRGASTILPTGFTQVGSQISPGGDILALAYRIVQPGDTASFGGGEAANHYLSEWAGSWSATPLDTYVTNTNTGTLTATATITPTAGRAALIIGGAMDYNGAVPPDTTYVASSGTLLDQSNDGQTGPLGGHPVTGVAYQTTASTSGAYTIALTATGGAFAPGASNWAEILAAFVQDASGAPPTPAQWFDFVATPPADGVATTFYAPFQFADGSLSVAVNRLDQTPAIVEYDGVCMSFRLAFAPKTGWLVEGRAQGR